MKISGMNAACPPPYPTILFVLPPSVIDLRNTNTVENDGKNYARGTFKEACRSPTLIIHALPSKYHFTLSTIETCGLIDPATKRTNPVIDHN